MRYIIPILFVTATVLVGCHSPSMVSTQTAAPPVASLPPFQPMFIMSLGTGTNTSLDGTWQIAVSETSLYMSCVGPGGTLGVPGWTAHKGWLVFLESDSRAWAYDGDRMIWLRTVTRSGNGMMWTNYVSPRFPCAVPVDVFSRLSETAQKVIQSPE